MSGIGGSSAVTQAHILGRASADRDLQFENARLRREVENLLEALTAANKENNRLRQLVTERT